MHQLLHKFLSLSVAFATRPQLKPHERGYCPIVSNENRRCLT
jgi:hypothetical protein